MRTLVSLCLLLCSIIVHGDIVTLSVDLSSKQFIVALPANPTTGYQWTLNTYDKSIMELASSEFVVSKSKLIGAGGEMTYTFNLIAGKTYPNTTQLQFTYARSWEPKSATTQEVTVNFMKPKS